MAANIDPPMKIDRLPKSSPTPPSSRPLTVAPISKNMVKLDTTATRLESLTFFTLIANNAGYKNDIPRPMRAVDIQMPDSRPTSETRTKLAKIVVIAPVTVRRKPQRSGHVAPNRRTAMQMTL